MGREAMVLLMLIVAPTMSVHAEGERADQEHGDRFGLEVKVEQRDGIAGLSVDCSGCIVDAAVFARHRGNERPQQRPASWLARFEESDGRSVVLVDLPEADLKTVELTAVVVVDDGIGAENVWRTIHIVDGMVSTAWDFQCATVPESCRRDRSGAIRELVDTEAQ
jgi:hypothetical protein